VLQYIGKRPAFHPVIIAEPTCQPYYHEQYSRTWPRYADKAGVPRSIRNMDRQAGVITEGSEAGADMEHLRQTAGHSSARITERYSRPTATTARKVAELRVAHRSKEDADG
jgi:hypothetical protein